MRNRALAVAISGLTACTSPPPPYAGLDRNSYGPLSNGQLQYCDPDARQVAPDSGVDQLAKGITGAIAAPFGGTLKPDQIIVKEGLQGYFKIPADMNRPNVVILSRDEKHILFWYILDLVSQEEVKKAADFYCAREKRSAINEGSSEKCDNPKWTPFVQNGQRVYQHSTFAISSFQCDSVGPGSSPSRNRASRPHVAQ